ncbi:MAG: hypothetical protein ACXVEF_19600 [Polyangiales bacterium]
MRSLFALVSIVALGCGSRVVIDDLGTTPNVDAALDGATDSTSTDSSTVDSSAIDTSAEDTAVPSETTCTALADAICTGAKPCCESSGFTYDETGCRNAINNWCDYQISAVDSGLAIYDGTQLAACTAGWKKSVAACKVDFLTWTKSYVPCTHLFNGVHDPGATCNPMGLDSLACHAPDGFASYCDSKVSRCRAYGVVPIGSPCNYTGSTIRYCDVGSYCDSADPSPTCKKALPIGADCAGPDDLSCGMFNVCKDNKCAKGLPSGAACTDNLECASYSCVMSTCASSDQTAVDKGICTGT